MKNDFLKTFFTSPQCTLSMYGSFHSFLKDLLFEWFTVGFELTRYLVGLPGTFFLTPPPPIKYRCVYNDNIIAAISWHITQTYLLSKKRQKAKWVWKMLSYSETMMCIKVFTFFHWNRINLVSYWMYIITENYLNGIHGNDRTIVNTYMVHFYDHNSKKN